MFYSLCEFLFINFLKFKLEEFRSKNYSLDKLSLVGIGMKHEFLVRFAEKFQLASSSSKQEQAKYLGSKGTNFL